MLSYRFQSGDGSGSGWFGTLMIKPALWKHFMIRASDMWFHAAMIFSQATTKSSDLIMFCKVLGLSASIQAKTFLVIAL